MAHNVLKLEPEVEEELDKLPTAMANKVRVRMQKALASGVKPYAFLDRDLDAEAAEELVDWLAYTKVLAPAKAAIRKREAENAA